MDPQPIAQSIQLAVAPIFLLTGIGALLNVMTARLARVVDRARLLESALEAGEPEELSRRHKRELTMLDARILSANRAILVTTVSAFLVCLVVALLFLAQFSPLEVAPLVAVLFVGTMSLLTLGLGFFLHEIAVATRSLQVRSEFLS